MSEQRSKIRLLGLVEGRKNALAQAATLAKPHIHPSIAQYNALSVGKRVRSRSSRASSAGVLLLCPHEDRFNFVRLPEGRGPVFQQTGRWNLNRQEVGGVSFQKKNNVLGAFVQVVISF